MTATALALALTLGLLAAPLAAEAQQPGKVYRIGFLSNAQSQSRLDAFQRGMRELGYSLGQNVVIETRSTDGRLEALPALAAELVGMGVDILVATDPPSTRAAKDATHTIPIVMRSTDDPVETGLVASLAHPGGNLTGLASLTTELSGKRLELLRDLVPRTTRVAVLWNSAWPGSVAALRAIESAARSLGLRLQPIEVRDPAGFEPAFRTAATEHADALITLRNGLIVTYQSRVGVSRPRTGYPRCMTTANSSSQGVLPRMGLNWRTCSGGLLRTWTSLSTLALSTAPFSSGDHLLRLGSRGPRRGIRVLAGAKLAILGHERNASSEWPCATHLSEPDRAGS